MSRVLSEAGYKVTSTDLIDRGFGRGGVDFLKAEKPLAKNIITNPPYGKFNSGLADAFVRKALEFTKQTGGKVAMLINIGYLADPRRHHAFVQTPPAKIFVLDRLVCYPEGRTVRSEKYGKMKYCWLIWEPDHQGKPDFWWLSTAPYKTER